MRQVRLRRASTAARLQLTLQQRRRRAERVPPRILGTSRRAGGHRVDLVHLVVGAVDLHIESDVEQVLVVGRSQARGDHPGVVSGIAVGHGHGGHDPGQLHFELHGAVEVEVPVEAVLVIAHRGDGAHDQSTRPPYFAAPGDHVDVLPEDAVVLLVHADGVGPSMRLAAFVGKDVVEVADLAEAVAAERQGVRHASQAPFAGVEGAFPCVHRARVPVGHDHLADRCPVDDGPDPPAILVPDRPQHQAFQRIHADPQ